MTSEECSEWGFLRAKPAMSDDACNRMESGGYDEAAWQLARHICTGVHVLLGYFANKAFAGRVTRRDGKSGIRLSSFPFIVLCELCEKGVMIVRSRSRTR
jgi:hypothetical protein